MPGEYQGALTGPQIDALPGQIAAKQPTITVTGALKGDGAGNLSQAVGTDIPLADAGDYFTTKNAEAALQQLANTLTVHGHGLASQAASGFMSAADKTKLDGIAAGAQVNSAITKAEIEAKLTGVISSHSHAHDPAVVRTKGTGTIPTTGWIASTGDYAYKLNIALAGVTSADNVLVMIDKDALDDASDCGLSATNESYAGGFTVYAESIPATTIAYSYVVIK